MFKVVEDFWTTENIPTYFSSLSFPTETWCEERERERGRERERERTQTEAVKQKALLRKKKVRDYNKRARKIERET